MSPWTRVLDWKPPHAKWFVGGKLNASANCLDRHIRGARRNKAAIIWEGEPGDRRVLTYWDLSREVGRCANALKRLGVKRGDRVAIYLPMVPEAAIAMLACARIGAVHSVVFGGFSAEALRDRINDAGAVVLITADGGYRRGQLLPLKRMADAAMAETPSIRHCIVVRRRPGGEGDESFAEMTEGRDHWWHRLLEPESAACRPEADGCRGSAVHPLHVRHHRKAQGDRAHDRRLSHPRDLHGKARLRPARRGRILVHRRHRLGHRAFVRRLRPAGERGHRPDVRGRSRLARAGPVLAPRREVRGNDPIHGADRDPGLHEVGHRAPQAARPLHPASAGYRGRADQSRGLDLVPRAASGEVAARSWTPGGRPRPAES